MLFTARAKPTTTAPTASTPQNDSSSTNNNTEQQQQQQTSSSLSSSTTTISPTSPISSSQQQARGAHARSVSFDITALSQQDAQKKGREAEHFLINFFLKKENLKASLLLEHLSRYNDHTNGFKGCWQFLCNKLYELELSDVEFYLPQLLNIYVRRVIEKKSPLERYFLEKSMESMHFAIRCCWLLDAQIQQLQMLQQMSSNAPLPAVPTSITNPQLIETNNSNNNSNNNNNNSNNSNGNNNSSLTSSLSASNLSLLKSTNMNNDQSIYTEDAPLTTLEKCIYLRSMVEQVCVNQLIPSWYIPRGVDQCSSSSSSSNNNGGGGGGESYLREDLINSNSQMANFVKSNVFSKQRRLNYFNDEMDFWNFLTDLSTRLKAYPTGPIRKQRMKLELEQLNKCIPSGCYVPQCTSNDAHCRIVRIVASECIVFSTKERVPYLIVAEVMEGPFTVSQPMLAHMMHGEFYEERVYNQQVYCSVTMHSPRMKTPNRTNSWPSSSSSSTASILSGGGSGGGGGRINNLEEIDFESYERSIDGISGGSTTSSGSGHHHQHHQHHNSQSVRSSTVRKVMSSSHGIIDSSIDIPVMGLERRSSADPRIESDSGILSDHRKRVEKDLGGDEDGDFVLVDRDKMMEADREALLRTVFGESWEEKKQRLQRTSPFGMAPGWDIKGFIVKSNDDIRQEQFAMQLIKMFQKIFLEEKLPVYLRTYAITVTNADSGIIEAVTDTASIDGLKKKFPNFTTLKDYYVKVYGSPESKRFRRAQQNFIESMAGYCVVCYLLQIKDRHNGNILIDREGNIVHIDFGFILGNSPGGVGFENAPFKLTAEMMDVMGGPDGEMFNNYFRPLVFMCFQAAAKHKEKVLSLIRMMSGINFACFMGDATAATTIRELDKRFNSQLDDMKFAQWVRSLVDESMDNWRTRQYDSFQRLTNGIL